MTNRVLTEGSFARGIIRDSVRHLIPDGGVYNAQDFLLEQPGRAYKRGGWARHSAALGANNSVAAVATIHIPTRVVAVGQDGMLYDVTGENAPQADLIGACWAPGENPPLYAGEKLIFCDNTNPAPGVPKQVYWDDGSVSIVVEPLFTGGYTVPSASRSLAHLSYLVLANDRDTVRRVWFAPDPDLEPDVDIADAWFDASNEVNGLASTQGVLLILSPVSVERVLGNVAPGRFGENMELQPLATVGCLDARTIVHLDEGVIFAGQDGVYHCNGAGVDSLLTGRIQSYWRSLFEPGVQRQLVGGLLGRDFYKLDVLAPEDNYGTVDTLLLHIPSGAWTRATNSGSRMMAQGRDESEEAETYMANAGAGYVEKLSGMLKPTWANRADGDSTDVEPVLELRPFGDAGVDKAFGFGHATYKLAADSGAPTLAAAAGRGLEPATFTTRATLQQADTVARKRFPFCQDDQAQTVRLTQTGATSETEVLVVEAEVRGYDEDAET